MGKNRKEKLFSVSKVDFDFLESHKQKAGAAIREQLKYQRLRKIDENALRIRSNIRDIKFKEKQLSENKFLERHPEFADDLKPKHILETEIDNLKHNVVGLERDIIEVKKVLEEDTNGGYQTVA